MYYYERNSSIMLKVEPGVFLDCLSHPDLKQDAPPPSSVISPACTNMVPYQLVIQTEKV